jgi:hypothetical protein
MASVYPATQWSSVVRGGIPCIAASDIVMGTIVRVASAGDWTVQMVATTTEQPLGIARDYAAAGQAVDVYDIGNITRVYASASITRIAQIHVANASTMVHPISGVTVSYPVAGPVVGASGTPLWSVGQAFESAAINDTFAVRVNPRQVVGLATSSPVVDSDW